MTQDTAARIELSVGAPIERAFSVFVERIGTWWPQSHRVKDDSADVVLEPKPGGRLYERAQDGTECDWGTVLAIDPPQHLQLSWEFTPTWQPSGDPARASRVDVWFTSTGPDTTSVILEHSGLERHGDGWEALRDSVSGDNGWSVILASYAALADH